MKTRSRGVRLFLACLCLSASGLAASNPWADWDAVASAGRSKFFRASVSDMAGPGEYANNRPWLAEELLFIQSNARVLVCQSPRGELRYMAMPTRVYSVPSGNEVPGMNYAVGMYYHFDSAALSSVRYQVVLEGETSRRDLLAADRQNETFYGSHFLPITQTTIGEDLQATVLSFAPVAYEGARAALFPAPLPGPAGAFYLLRLKNGGKRAVRGNVFLEVGKELDGRRAESAFERNTLILSTPKSHAAIHLSHGTWKSEENEHVAARTFELQPEQEIMLETRVALGGLYGDVMPVIHELFMHSPIDWLNQTALFWQERLGRLRLTTFDAGEEAEVSRDIYYRCLIDNFSCLQTDAAGNLVAHYQGAPKAGTIWGIDYEPTIVSAMQVCPELGRQGLLFALGRNRAPRTKYGPEHSTAILVAPLIIARKWLETTGDVDFFRRNPGVMTTLTGVVEDLGRIKAPKHDLYPARYSSDGPVGRRYDHGTNVKVWYALSSMGYLFGALGDETQANRFREAADKLRLELERTMVANGPFGLQISGGTNLGEDPGDFYLPEEILYYDGEDTGSHLAPIYGIYGFDYAPWVNYHRWARSIFCPWYEPEFRTLRWFPSWSMPVLDGTGFFSILGGSVTAGEMKEALSKLRRMADETGSVHWWPMGLNFKQGLSRCSQGQGTWAWQYLEQWLGVQVDATSRTITVAPRGLLTSVDWKGFRAGPNAFDLAWEETAATTRVEIKNLNRATWNVRVAFRPFDSGAEDAATWKKAQAQPGATVLLETKAGQAPATGPAPADPVRAVEAAKLGEDGIVFMRYGTVDPFPGWYHLWQEEHLDVRFYLVNGTGADWSEATVTLSYPAGWMAKGRTPGYWLKADNLQPGKATLDLGGIRSMRSAVAPFQVRGPHLYNQDFLTAGKSKHFPSEAGPEVRLATRDVRQPQETEFEAVLRAKTADGTTIERRLTVPVRIVPIPNERL